MRSTTKWKLRIRLLLLSQLRPLACSGRALFHRRGTLVAARAAASARRALPSTSLATASTAAPPTVIEPQVRSDARSPCRRSDPSNVELGGYYGEISIEDFGAQPVAGLRFDYHITEDFFFEGAATVAPRPWRDQLRGLLSGGVQLLSDAERRLTYYNLSLGYNLLPGEIFIGHNYAMTSALYTIGGIGKASTSPAIRTLP